MFSWLNSPQLPDTIETQAFRSISGGPTLRVNAINDRTHRMKLVPWEDILEVFPNAIYLRDANGIVMPARDQSLKRINPRSFKLQADVVLEVVTTHDIPPTSSRPDNITKTEDLVASESTKAANTAANAPLARLSTEHQAASARTSTSTAASYSTTGGASTSKALATAPTQQAHQQQQQQQEDDTDWSPFQANSAAFPGPTLSSGQAELLRQEMIHRLELLSAEQEERFEVLLKACRRPTP